MYAMNQSIQQRVHPRVTFLLLLSACCLLGTFCAGQAFSVTHDSELYRLDSMATAIDGSALSERQVKGEDSVGSFQGTVRKDGSGRPARLQVRYTPGEQQVVVHFWGGKPFRLVLGTTVYYFIDGQPVDRAGHLPDAAGKKQYEKLLQLVLPLFSD